MANIIVSTTALGINVSETVSNISVTDVESNVIVTNVASSVANVTVSSTDTTVNVSQTASISNASVRTKLGVENVSGYGNLAYDSTDASNGIFQYTGVSNADIITVIDDNPANVTQHLSVVDTGGDGSLSYANATGVFTYTGPSAAEVRAHISLTDAGGDGSMGYNPVTGVITYQGPDQAEANARIAAAPTQVRAHISGVSPITYNASTGAIGLEQTLDDLTLKKYQETIVDSGNVSGTAVFNITDGTVHTANITGNITNISLTNISAGGSATLFLKQDAVGGRVLDTTSFSGTWKFVNENIILDQNPSATSILNIFYDGTVHSATLVDYVGDGSGTDNVPQGNIDVRRYLSDSTYGPSQLLMTNYLGVEDGTTSSGITANANATYAVQQPGIAIDSRVGFNFTSDSENPHQGAGGVTFPGQQNVIIGDYGGLYTATWYKDASGNIQRASSITGARPAGVEGINILNQSFENSTSVTGLGLGFLNKGTAVGESANVFSGYLTFPRSQESSDGSLTITDGGSPLTSGVNTTVNPHIKVTSRGLHSSATDQANIRVSIATNTTDASNTLLVDGSIGSTSNVTATGNIETSSHLITNSISPLTGNVVTVFGNMEVNGNLNVVEKVDLLLQDSSITLNYGNATARDAQIIVDRSGSALANTDLRWNETADKWQFTNDGSTYNNMLTLADIPAQGVTSVNGDTGPAVTLDTDDIAEGTAKYYATSLFNTDFATKTTTDLSEGTNLYFTNARADARVNLQTGTNLDLSSKSTTDLSEGTNLYYTQSRVRGDVDGETASASGTGSLVYDSATGMFTYTPPDISNKIELTSLSVSTVAASGDGALSYNNATGVFTFTPADTSLATKSTTDLAEGTNLYYTDARVATKIDSYVVGSENITVTSGEIATTPALGNINSITTEASSGFTLDSNDGIVFKQKFNTVATPVSSIAGDGYALFGGNEYSATARVTYTGTTALSYYEYEGTITSGSPDITVNNMRKGTATFTVGSLVTGTSYIIVATGTTDFTAIGSADNNPGTVFTATGAGTGTGTVRENILATVGDLNVGYNQSGTTSVFPNEAYVLSVNTGTNTITMSTDAIASGSISYGSGGGDQRFDPAAIDTTTGLVISLLSGMRYGGTGSETIIASQQNRKPGRYGYPQRGPVASDFDIYAIGSSADYTFADASDFTVARTSFTAANTVIKANEGIVIGQSTDLTNRGENDVFKSFGINMLWDGLTTTPSSQRIQPAVLLKSYSDNAYGQTNRSSGAPRLFFTTANGNINDNPYGAHPLTNQELGRTSYWGSTGTQLQPSSYNVPAYTSVQAADNWNQWNGGVAGNTNVYNAATSNGVNADTYLAYKEGELFLGSNSTKPITLAPASQTTGQNPQNAYSGAVTSWANVHYASGTTGAKFTVTNGGSEGAGVVGDMELGVKRVDNSATVTDSISTTFSSTLLQGALPYGWIMCVLPFGSTFGGKTATISAAGTIVASATGNETALGGNSYTFNFVYNGATGGVYYISSGGVPVTYTSIGGADNYSPITQNLGMSGSYIISSGVTGREWKFNLAEQSEDLILSSNSVDKVTFTSDQTTFTNIPVMPSHSNVSLPASVAGGIIYVTNSNNKPAYGDGTNWYYYDNTQVT